MGKGCPVCGCRKYKSARVDPSTTVIVKPRICKECGHRYVAPLPRWIGLIAYVMALLVVSWMLVDWMAPPRDLSMRFTWTGRLAVVCFAGSLVWMGTLVLRGKTGYE
jgi:hypothetical protein